MGGAKLLSSKVGTRLAGRARPRAAGPCRCKYFLSMKWRPGLLLIILAFSLTPMFMNAVDAHLMENFMGVVYLQPDSSYARAKIAMPVNGELVTTRQTLAPACYQFIDQKGRLGNYGRLVFEAMVNSPYRERFLNEGLSDFCPGFARFAEYKKMMAWVWFFMGLSNEESSCTSRGFHDVVVAGRRINPALNYGLFALEFSPRMRAHRGAACRGDIREIGKQVECAVDIMGVQLAGENGAHTCGSYWGPVRRGYRWQKGEPARCRSGGFKRGQIQPYMERFEGCFPPSAKMI